MYLIVFPIDFTALRNICRRRVQAAMKKKYMALQFATVLDREKLERETKKMEAAGFSREEAENFILEKSERTSPPPISFQRIVGVYGIILKQKDSGEPPVVRSFAAAGSNEGSLVNFAFRIFAELEPSKKDPPVVFCGNEGYAMQILLSKTNERTLAERSGIVLRSGDNSFIAKNYGNTLSLFLDTSDKFGTNYTNKYSKVLFDPRDFDSLYALPVHIAAGMMFREKDWYGMLNLSRRACEDIFLRSVNILDNQKNTGIKTGDDRGGEEESLMYPELPAPGDKCAFVTITGKKHRAVKWEDVEKYATSRMSEKKIKTVEEAPVLEFPEFQL